MITALVSLIFVCCVLLCLKKMTSEHKRVVFLDSAKTYSSLDEKTQAELVRRKHETRSFAAELVLSRDGALSFALSGDFPVVTDHRFTGNRQPFVSCVRPLDDDLAVLAQPVFEATGLTVTKNRDETATRVLLTNPAEYAQYLSPYERGTHTGRFCFDCVLLLYCANDEDAAYLTQLYQR